MKKLLTILVCLLTVFSLAACGKKEAEVVEYDYAAKSEGVMTYADYMAAEIGAEVKIEAYVQAVQSYWGGATMYLSDTDGAYFVYQDSSLDPDISEEDYAKLGVSTSYGAGWTGLANGQKVLVTGVKSEWAGEVEISGSALVPLTVSIVEEGVTYKVAANEISLVGNGVQDHMNQLVAIKDLEVTSAAIYNWDGSGAEGNNNDLYYNVKTVDGGEFSLVVESYLMYEGSDVYNAVKALNVGDKIDVEGFLYWYNGAQLHTTAVTVK